MNFGQQKPRGILGVSREAFLPEQPNPATEAGAAALGITGLRGANPERRERHHLAIRTRAGALRGAMVRSQGYSMKGEGAKWAGQAPPTWMHKLVEGMRDEVFFAKPGSAQDAYLRQAICLSAWEVTRQSDKDPHEAVKGQDCPLKHPEDLRAWGGCFPVFVEQERDKRPSMAEEEILIMANIAFMDRVGAVLVDRLGQVNLNIELDSRGMPRRVSEIGCIPIYYITKDGGILSPEAVEENLDLTNDPDDPQWYVLETCGNEENQDLVCDHTGNRIPSAYGEEDEAPSVKLGDMGNDMDAYLHRISTMGDDLLVSEVRSYGRPTMDTDPRMTAALDQLLREAADRGVLTDYCEKIEDGMLPPECIRREADHFVFRIAALGRGQAEIAFRKAVDVFGPLISEGATQTIDSWIGIIKGVYDLERRPDLLALVDAIRVAGDMVLSPGMRSAIQANRDRQAQLHADYDQMKANLIQNAERNDASVVVPTFAQWLEDQKLKAAGEEAEKLDQVYADAAKHDAAMEKIAFEKQFSVLCQRTEDPKLAFIEHLLTEADIPHVRRGYSSHAPLLWVSKDRLVDAEKILGARWKNGLNTLDQVADDLPEFHGFKPQDFEPEAEASEFDPKRDGWVGNDGRP